MKRLLVTFLGSLGVCFVVSMVAVPLIWQGDGVSLALVDLIAAALLTALFRHTVRLEELEERIEKLESKDKED